LPIRILFVWHCSERCSLVYRTSFYLLERPQATAYFPNFIRIWPTEMVTWYTVDKIFYFTNFTWQKLVGRGQQRDWMSETFENRQFFIMSLVCDWFSHSGQVETTMLWKGRKLFLPRSFEVLFFWIHKILFQFVCIIWNAYFKMSQLPNSAETRCTLKQQEIGLLRMCFSSSQLCHLTWHTSSSTPLHTRCTCAGPSCTAWRFLEQGGHLGWGHREENR